jgi:type I restriction enzyme M protein
VNVKSIDKETSEPSVTNPDGGEKVKYRCPQKIMDEIAKLDVASAKLLENIRKLL